MKIEVYLETGDDDKAIDMAKALIEHNSNPDYMAEVAEHLMVYSRYRHGVLRGELELRKRRRER